MLECYFAKEPPDVEIRGEMVFIRPSYANYEIAITPQMLQKIVAKYNRILDELHERSGATVVRLARIGPI
jgi:hypothetical protein